MQHRIAVISVILELNDMDEDEDNRAPRGPDRKWIRGRPEKGAFVSIFKDLELTDHEGFRRYMRMDIAHFQELIALFAIIDGSQC